LAIRKCKSKTNKILHPSLFLAICGKSGWNLATFFKIFRDLATKNSKQIANLLKKQSPKNHPACRP
jgi:hypothetical protein